MSVSASCQERQERGDSPYTRCRKEVNKMERKLNDSDKLMLLQKAADIAIQAASVTSTPDLLAEIIESTYNKMLALATKA